MIKIHDDLFDFRYIFELAYSLQFGTPWFADNIANRNRWPYNETGTHRFLGHLLFNKKNGDRTASEEILQNYLKIAEFIKEKFKLNLEITEINLNLQFQGMDGTFHIDGNDQEKVFILMLAYEDVGENDGGEFVHKPTNQKIPFKKGRLIEMTASDEHKGLAFNKSNIVRFSAKFLYS